MLSDKNFHLVKFLQDFVKQIYKRIDSCKSWIEFKSQSETNFIQTSFHQIYQRHYLVCIFLEND